MELGSNKKHILIDKFGIRLHLISIELRLFLLFHLKTYVKTLKSKNIFEIL